MMPQPDALCLGCNAEQQLEINREYLRQIVVGLLRRNATVDIITFGNSHQPQFTERLEHERINHTTLE